MFALLTLRLTGRCKEKTGLWIKPGYTKSKLLTRGVKGDNAVMVD